MTKEIFFAHKEGIAEAMRSALIMSKHRGYALHSYCLTHDTITVCVLKDDTDEAKIGKLKEVNKYCELYGAPSIHDSTEKPNCVSYFRGTYYAFRKPKLRDKIEDTQIEQKMRTLVRKELGLHVYQDLECKVMALFKEGHISWDEVMEQHGKACTL